MPRAHTILVAVFMLVSALQASAQTADLLISKSAPESAIAGTTIVYSLFVFNNGPGGAQNVVVVDDLPAGTTFVSLTSSTSIFSCTTPPVGGSGRIQCSAPNFLNQEETSFTLSVNTFASATSGVLSNTATITSATSDPSTSDNSSTASTGIVARSNPSADVAIQSMDASSTVAAGDTVTFRVVVANKGPFAAHNVHLVDAPPANTTFFSATVEDSSGAFTCTTPAVGTTGNITCTAAQFDVLTPDQQPSFLFTFRVHNGAAAGTVLTNLGLISADESDPTSSNNTASKSTTVRSQPPSADLLVSTNGAGSTFNITVTNAGPNDASLVTLTDTVPSGSTFVSWTQLRGPHFDCTTPAVGGTGSIVCKVDVMPGVEGQLVSADFELAVNSFAPVTNNVTVSSTTPDPRPDNNSSSFPVAATLTVNDVSVAEGNSGSTPAVFIVRLQPPNSSLTATVDYAVTSLTATDGFDFISSHGTLTFLAGETQKTITVPVLGDTIVEGNEFFSVQLSNPVNATLRGGTAIGSIIDDDRDGSVTVPVVTIANVTVTEGNVGTTSATFTARLSAASNAVTRVRWRTEDATALAGSDYVATSGELVFQPGETEKSFSVTVLGDLIYEPDEAFRIVVTGTDNATVAATQITGFILNDDAQVPPRHRAARH